MKSKNPTSIQHHWPCFKVKELDWKNATELVELILETKNKELAEKESQYQQELAKLRAHIAELESAMVMNSLNFKYNLILLS